MRLSSIQMSGFKSFVEPTRVVFDLPLTGVVGPNGCGKSNIIDAVRWVLGETARNIRGETIDDIIFDGSESRKRLDQASVEVVIDNSEGRIGGEYASFSEISIRRETSRDMDRQSRYYINGAQVRRKDVSDLFQGTGLGRGNYAIIAQGMVQGLIEARPEEMRKYIEEVAGISLYRERRRETENRIRRTEENLERLQDILKDQAQRLQHLEQQKGQAEKQSNLQKEFRERENEWLSLQLREQRRILETRKQEHEMVEQKRVGMEGQLEALGKELEEKRAAYEGERQSVEEAVSAQQQALADANALEQQIRLGRESKERALQENERVEVEIWELEERLQKDEEELQTHQAQHEKSSTVLAEVSAARDKVEAAREEQAKTSRECQEKSEALREKLSAAREDRSREQAQLRQYEDELGHLQETGGPSETDADPQAALQIQCGSLQTACQQCREWLELNATRTREAREGLKACEETLTITREQRTQAQGRLASLETLQQSGPARDAEAHAQALADMRLQGSALVEGIEVDEGWEFAVEIVLADSLGAFCVGDLPESISEERIAGGSPLVLLDDSSPAEPRSDPMLLMSRVRSRFSLQSLLGGVLAAETLEQAWDVRAALQPHQSVVTRSGVWMGTDWIRLPAAEDRAEGALERQREIEALSERLQWLEEETAQAEQKKRETEAELRAQEEGRGAIQDEYDRVFQALAEAQARLQGLENQAQRLASLQQSVQASREHLRQSETLIESLEQERSRADAERDAAAENLRQSYKESRQRVDECNRLQIEVNAARMGVENKQQQLERERAALARCRERQEQLPKELPNEEDDTALQKQLAERQAKEKEAMEILRKVRTKSDKLEQEVQELDRRRWEVNQQSSDLGKDLHEKDLKRQEIQGVCEQFLGRLHEHECDPEQVLHSLPEHVKPEVWEEKVEKVSRRIEKMPPVNMAAAREYDELLQEKEQEEARMQDVLQALDKLNHAMAKIDNDTRERFRRTFDAVNENLKQLFPRIIGKGGEASLVMTEQNLLSTGVEVHACPPGKRHRSMHMLSGGEQAMVAVSLVLSLFMLNPAPFCVLDEVDAPLSDDNLYRFCQILGEMSEQVQFIVVTHNKITMEHVGQLVGVTMHEAGVSRLVSVNVAQAMEMVEQQAEDDRA